MFSCSPMWASRQVPLVPFTLYLFIEGTSGAGDGEGWGGIGGTVGEGPSCSQRVSGGTRKDELPCSQEGRQFWFLRTKRSHSNPQLQFHLPELTVDPRRLSNSPASQNTNAQVAQDGTGCNTIILEVQDRSPHYTQCLAQGKAPLPHRAG